VDDTDFRNFDSASRRSLGRTFDPRDAGEVAFRILTELPEKHRRALIQYYARGQRAELVQQQFDLTEDQFRQIRADARARFAALRSARRKDGASVVTELGLRRLWQVA
jgi:DNA-directed RNA polymerase specialized sigma24 family protein